MIIDLHMHSNVSDGKLSPADLVRLVHANGVELMALTDHDTMDGVRQASAAAEELGVGFIPGVEISTGWGGRVVHIVGLGVDPDAPGIDAFFSSICTKRDRRGRLIGERFEQFYGIRGAYEGALSLADNKDNLSRTHFARWPGQEGVEGVSGGLRPLSQDGEALLRRHIDWMGPRRAGRRHPHRAASRSLHIPDATASASPGCSTSFSRPSGTRAARRLRSAQDPSLVMRTSSLRTSRAAWTFSRVRAPTGMRPAPCVPCPARSRRFPRISRPSGASFRVAVDTFSNSLSTFTRIGRRARRGVSQTFTIEPSVNPSGRSLSTAPRSLCSFHD